MNEPRPASKIWLETDEGYVFGPGVYNLLKAIKDKGTLKEASQSLDMSYRFAWGLIKKAEDKLGVSLIEASKGGRQGGGSSRITDLGEHFITDFEKIQKAWRDFREQYEKSTLIKAKIVLIEGEPALRIDEPIYFENISSLPPGEEVKLRILLN
jgi:molybdate transport repressor ModE-like protein